jgi:Flp pilus assembly pilin Flp
VEYALILILVSVAAITLLTAVGAFPSSVFSSVNADF